MARAFTPTYIRRRGDEDYYLGGALELGGDLDMGGFSIVNFNLASIVASTVGNDSSVAGATVKDALETLDAGGGGGGVARFPELLDTPADYAGASLRYAKVNVGETGLEFVAFDQAFSDLSDGPDYAAEGDKYLRVNAGGTGLVWDDVVIPAVPVDSVFGRVGAVAAVAGDYVASEVTNDSGVAGAFVSDALDALAALSVTYPLLGPDGFSSSPPFSFANSTNSGMWWQGGRLSLGEGASEFLSSDGATSLLKLPTTLNMQTLSQRVEFLTSLMGTGVEPQAASGTVLTYEGGSAVTRTLQVAVTNLGAVVTYVNNGTANLTVVPQGGDAIIDSGLTVGALVIPPDHAARLCAAVATKWTVTSKTEISAAGSELPPGSVTQFAGAAHPAGFLLCDGDEYDELVYPALFAVIGAAWNTGGETAGFFRVPDFRARVAGGVNADNGALTLRSLGEAAGVESHTHTMVEQPGTGIGVNLTIASDGAHKHTVLVTAGTDNHVYQGGGWNTDQVGGHTHAGSSATSSVPAHDHGGATGGSSDIDPTLFINYIIKT